MQYTSFTLDEELNSLIHGTLFYVNMYRSYKLLNMVHFLAHPVCNTTYVLHCRISLLRRTMMLCICH